MRLLFSLVVLAIAAPVASGGVAHQNWPLAFEANRGQVDPRIQFVSRARDHALYLTSTEVIWRFRGERVPASMRLEGANRAAKGEGAGPAAGRSNYLLGNQASRWHIGVPLYSRVRFAAVYPGIDLVYHGGGHQLEYDWVVAPGADPARIRLSFGGIESMRVDARGDLRLRLPGGGEMMERQPVAYQERPGVRQTVNCRYVIRSGRVRFEVGRYDRKRPLVIDPVLSYATFLGGSNMDSIRGTAVDPQGNVYVAGMTTSVDLPIANPLPDGRREFQIYRSTDAGAAWAAHSNLPSGLIYSLAIDPVTPSTLFAGGYDTVFKSSDGGSHWRATGVTFPQGAIVPPFPEAAISGTGVVALAVDSRNPRNVYGGRLPGGVIRSTDGGETWRPTNSGLPGEPRLLYVSNLAVDPFSPSTVYATLFPGTLFRSTDGTATWSAVEALPLPARVYRVLFHPAARGVVYAVTSGGVAKSADGGQTWALRGAPRLLVNPSALALDPVNPDRLYGGDSPGFTRSLDGGATWENISLPNVSISRVEVNPANPQIILATTRQGVRRSTDGGFTWEEPTVTGGVWALLFDPRSSDTAYAVKNISQDLFIAKLSPGGDRLIYATYLGGGDVDSAAGLGVDRDGNAVITGYTLSRDFPVTTGAFQPQIQGQTNAFITKLNASGDGLVYSTYLGGNAFDLPRAVAVDGDGSAYLTGSTVSTDFPTTSAAFQTAFHGTAGLFYSDAFVAKFSGDGRLIYSTFVGGSGFEGGNSIVVDAEGQALVTGSTSSPDFPVTFGTQSGGVDAFLVKLSAGGERLLLSRYLGGSATDSGEAVAIDSDGNIFVAGWTQSTDFPVTPGAYQSTLRSRSCSYSLGCAPGCIGPSSGALSPQDIFITKLDRDGDTTLFSTLAGGDCASTPKALAVDGDGNVYFLAGTRADRFPTRFPFQSARRCGEFSSVAGKLNATGTELLFATFFDGGNEPSMAFDPAGTLYVSGTACAAALVTPGALQTSVQDNTNGYLAKIDFAPAVKLALNSVANAFSFREGTVSPGEFVALSGEGLGPDEAVDLGINPPRPLETSLADTRVLFDGIAAALMMAQAQRVVAVVPYSLAGKTNTEVRVEYRGELSNALVARVMPANPALLTADGSGQGQANARNSDGTANSPGNPADRGSVILLYATGLGVTSPAGVDGGLGGDPPARPALQTRAFIGSMPAEALDVAAVPGFVMGLFELRVRIPGQVVVGDRVPVFISAGGNALSQLSQSVTIAVR